MIIQSLPHYPAVAAEPGTIELVGYKSVLWFGVAGTKTISLTDLIGGAAAAPSEGDFVVLSMAITNGGTNYNLNPVTTGYTEHCDIFENDTVCLNFGVFSKFMGVSPDTQVQIQSFNSEQASVRIQVWRGVNATPMDVAVVTNSGIDTPNATSPAIAPVTAGAMVVDAAACTTGNALNVLVQGNPGSFSPFQASKQGKLSSCMGAKEWPGSGAMGPYVHGAGSSNVACWAALQMALRPA